MQQEILSRWVLLVTPLESLDWVTQMRMVLPVNQMKLFQE